MFPSVSRIQLIEESIVSFEGWVKKYNLTQKALEDFPHTSVENVPKWNPSFVRIQFQNAQNVPISNVHIRRLSLEKRVEELADSITWKSDYQNQQYSQPKPQKITPSYERELVQISERLLNATEKSCTRSAFFNTQSYKRLRRKSALPAAHVWWSWCSIRTFIKCPVFLAHVFYAMSFYIMFVYTALI